ncbi:MAG TPA: cytidylate kinase-like family protein [Acidobacteriota bacterium]|nr:cytidylate kinase-like family protein [Acidobacteriota bacterium]
MSAAISIITISREFGSGGRDIAARLGARLGWRVVDRDLVRSVAERLGVPEQEVAERDEQVAGLAERVGAYLADVFPEMLLPPPPLNRLDHRTVRTLVETTLREAAERSPVIVVGRGSQCIFAGRPNALHVRVWAPFEIRVSRMAERLGLDLKDARERVAREDAQRREFLRRCYGIEMADQRHYDLVVSTAHLDVEQVVAALAEVVRLAAGGGSG